jgi:hypothetical protein
MVDRTTTRATPEALSGLRELAAHGWQILSRPDAEPAQHVRIDHVVVGPAGAFALDVRDWPGAVTVRNELLRVDERSRDHLVRETVAAAAALATAIPIDLRAHVHPVVVLRRDEPLELTARTLLVCSSRSLVPALTEREPVWSPGHVEFVAALLGARIDPAGAPVLPRVRPRRATVPLQRAGSPVEPGRGGGTPAEPRVRRQVGSRIRLAFRPRS